MSGLLHVNPEGSAPPYKDLFSNVTIIPPGAKVAYVSTQWACDSTGQLIEGGKGNFHAQAKQTWLNAFTILKGLGCTMKDVVHRGNRHYEFSEEIAKKCIEGSIEACPPEQLEDFFKS
ncbi:MAG: hypothetical protein M1839_006937 [Geoglossum umbratile]|nr:MAG: hypothetical protein M1839_006937 [Geoglossum umbratile]